MHQTLLFIDADNQPPALAPKLARFFRGMSRQIDRAIIAGNGSGDRVRGWQKALNEAFPDAKTDCYVAPMRKQSADVLLVFELGALYHGAPDGSSLITILSRDDLLIAAAECLAAKGHNMLIAVGTSANSTPLLTELPVVVLFGAQPSANKQTVEQPSPTPAMKASPAVGNTGVVAEAVSTIRKSLVPNKQGGYAASAVGQVLAQLGHDKAMRAKIVATIPNVREVGTGPEKRLIF